MVSPPMFSVKGCIRSIDPFLVAETTCSNYGLIGWCSQLSPLFCEKWASSVLFSSWTMKFSRFAGRGTSLLLIGQFNSVGLLITILPRSIFHAVCMCHCWLDAHGNDQTEHQYAESMLYFGKQFLQRCSQGLRKSLLPVTFQLRWPELGHQWLAVFHSKDLWLQDGFNTDTSSQDPSKSLSEAVHSLLPKTWKQRTVRAS